MKMFMSTDLEGVAGVVSFESQTYQKSGPALEEARSLQTAEINAAVAGFVEAGIEDILIGDHHGPGAVKFSELDAPAKLMHGRPWPPRSVRDPIVAEYDVFCIVGQHAMAGVRDGDLNHTQSSRSIDYIKLNGKPIGEIAQAALYNGAMGMPLIFLTGDEAACREAEELVPGIVTVAVKKGIGRNAAISLPASEARALIREGAKRAIENHKKNPIAPLVWEGPFVLEKRFFHTDTADQYMDADDVEMVDGQTVRMKGDDIRKIIYR